VDKLTTFNHIFFGSLALKSSLYTKFHPSQVQNKINLLIKLRRI